MLAKPIIPRNLSYLSFNVSFHSFFLKNFTLVMFFASFYNRYINLKRAARSINLCWNDCQTLFLALSLKIRELLLVQKKFPWTLWLIFFGRVFWLIRGNGNVHHVCVGPAKSDISSFK